MYFNGAPTPVDSKVTKEGFLLGLKTEAAKFKMTNREYVHMRRVARATYEISLNTKH